MDLCGKIFRLAIFSCAIFPASAAFGAEKVRGSAVVPLVQAHAHNDYRHARPLLDALDHGFCSVEADIFLVNGELLIGHNPIELTPRRTLEKLYLAPLRRRVQENGGRVFSGGPRVALLIDIKTNGPKTYQVLREVLADYKDILSSVENGRRIDRAVDVVISGNRPWEDITREKVRYAGIDGRLADLESTAPAHLLPLISDRWTSHFRWRGEGEISAAEREKLQSIVARAHRAGRRVRFWATPESPSLWKELAEQGVDHINTDDLAGLQTFLLQRRGKNNAAAAEPIKTSAGEEVVAREEHAE